MRKEKSQTEDARVSNEMVQNIKKDMLKHKNFYDFLVSVFAMEKKGSDYVAIEYGSKDYELYEERCIKRYRHDLNDQFVFKEKSKKMYKDDYGKLHETDSFLPMTFWVHVLDIIKFGKK